MRRCALELPLDFDTVTEQRLPNSFAKCITESLLLAVVIVSAQLIAMALFPSTRESVGLELQAGIGIGWLLARGPRAWLGVFLGAALSDALVLYAYGTLEANGSLAVTGLALSQGIADLLSALVVYGLARALLRWPIALVQPREIILFIGIIVPSGVLVGTVSERLADWMWAVELTGPMWQILADAFAGRLLVAVVCSVVLLVALCEPREVWIRRRSMAVFIPLAFIGIVWAANAVATSARKERFAEFRALVGTGIAELEIELVNHEMIASALTAFYASSRMVERHEFTSFAEPLCARLPNVQAVSWEPLLVQADRAKFVSEARVEGFVNFEIYQRDADGKRVEAAVRPEYFPIWFIHPAAGNQAAIGYDLFSEPTRHEAITRARQTGRTCASAPIRLVQARNEVGVLLLAPINSNETGALAGFVSVVVNATRVCARIGDLLGTRGVHFSVTDESAPAGQGLLYATAGATSTEASADDAFKVFTDVKFAGRNWRTEATASQVYAKTSTFWEFFSQSGAFALLLTLVTGAQLYTSGRGLLVESVVRERSLELLRSSERFRSLLDGAPAAMIAVSASGRIVMANREVLDVFGYSLDQVLGQSPDMLLARTREHASSAAPLVQLRDAGEGKARIVTCQTRAGEQLRVQLRQSVSVVGGEQLTAVVFQRSVDHTPRSLA